MKRDYKQEIHLYLLGSFMEWYGVLEKEFKFHPTRRWRFDWAFPKRKIAIEYEGIFSAKSRHTSIVGFSNDCEKYSEAAIMGWKVIRVTALMVQSGKAFELFDKL